MIIKESKQLTKQLSSKEAIQQGIVDPATFVSVDKEYLLLVDHVDVVILSCDDFRIAGTLDLEGNSINSDNERALENLIEEFDSLRQCGWLPVRMVGAKYTYL